MTATRTARFLDTVERLGNRLPEPAMLFAWGALLVALLSQLGAGLGWSVEKPVLGPQGSTREVVSVRGLLDADGIWWAIGHAVQNFIEFPPLGIVLVGMLGIGVAERSGLMAALLKASLARIGSHWLTPAVVFVGVMSSMALDAGYIVLPPLAAALYLACGRPPVAGLAAVFAGISGGFSANLLITALDPLLAGLTQAGAQLLDPDYRVAVTANWWFMIASTLLLTAVGWAVTAHWVEPRLAGTSRAERDPAAASTLSAPEQRGLRRAGWAVLVLLLAVMALALIPGAPLHGMGNRFPRWVEAVVPLLFLGFWVPGLVYGRSVGVLGGSREVVAMMSDTIAALGPYIVLSFFAAQFIGWFNYSRLGEMLAITGGNWLAALRLPAVLLVVAFALLSMAGNLLIGSASAKYALYAPVFVPMLMQAGISPELTQAAYRIGDSTTNIITPLNPYYTIVLASVQRYARDAGIGTLVALMLPYTAAFAVAWLLLLALWVGAGWPLGPGGGLEYGVGG